MPIRNRLSRRHSCRHFFRGTSESSISFCLLVWNCRQNGVKILTWLGWFFNVPVNAFLFRHHFERTRLVNACSQYRFLPLGQDHFSPLLSLLFSLFFPSSRFWSRCCTCVCEWMDTCLKVNHDFKKLSVYKCLGCCNLKCLKMTLLVSKDRIGEGGY